MCDEIIAKKLATFAKAYEIANAFEATRKTTNKVKESCSSAKEVMNKLGYGPPKVKRDKKPSRQLVISRTKTTKLSHRDSMAQMSKVTVICATVLW